MLRKEFQELARTRVREARRLLDAGEYSGAYYLSGFAIECALKSCIAKQTKRHEFPDKNRANEAFVHDPVKLARLAGLDGRIQQESNSSSSFAANWAIVKDWKVESRYEHRSQTDAQALYKAITSKTHGVLRWLRQHW